MPDEYSEKPPTVCALQFVGTPESAFEINAWLSNYGFTVIYDSPRHQLVIQTAGGTYLQTVKDTDWVCMNPKDQIVKILTDSDFQDKYEAVNPPEVIPEPEPEATPEEEPDPEEPPAEDPPVEDPPAEDPPIEDPPVEDPPGGGA